MFSCLFDGLKMYLVALLAGVLCEFLKVYARKETVLTSKAPQAL